jgi:phosphatidylinositol alpha 1,6-mannosyltransferase
MPGKTGELVPPRDPAAFAEAVIRILSDDGYHATLAQGARAFAERRTWTSILDRLLEHYRDAVDPGGVKRAVP